MMLKLAFWWLREKWAEWRLYRKIGGGDAERGRRIFRKAMALMAIEEVLACMEKYSTDGMTAAAIEQYEEEFVDWHLGGRSR